MRWPICCAAPRPTRKDPVIIINADANATHQSVIHVMEAARQAGIVPHHVCDPVARQVACDTAERVVAAWYAPRVTVLAALLWPLSLPYRLVVALRRALFRAGALRVQRMPVPVIVVGNITVGGTGKTPLVRALAEHLAARGFRPGIVSRGHGGSETGPVAVAADDDPRRVGDEPPLHAAAGFPVWIGRDRPAAARALLAAHPQCDVLIADDGLQHYALARDVEIVAVDAARGLGNGLMLPAGPLRESVTRLVGVDAVVRVSVAPERPPPVVAGESLAPLVPLHWRNLCDPTLSADPQQWRGRPVHALAGIGDPGRFSRCCARWASTRQRIHCRITIALSPPTSTIRMPPRF